MKFKKINLSSIFSKSVSGSDSTSCGNTGPVEYKSGKRGVLGLGGIDGEKGYKNGQKNRIGAGSCKENKDYTDTHSVRYGNGYYNEKNRFSGDSCVISNADCSSGEIRDRGNEPIVFDIRKEAFMTPDFRTALWTGGNLQLTVMTIPVGDETGVERHEGLDQLIGVISGAAEVIFGNRENYFSPPVQLDAHSVVLIPAGTYHNIKNVGRTPLKLYSVYAPKAHKFGTVDKENPNKK